MRNKRPLKDYSGRRYGRLVALYPSAITGKWIWKCDCGSLAVKSVKSVRDGNTRSCGCLFTESLVNRNTTHGLSKAHPRTYRSWKDMRSRCYNPNNTEFHNYGGRGITVCEKWASFAQFFADMGDRPEGLTIERRDVNCDYEPNNCEWATPEVQSNNKRNTVRLTINGETKSLAMWCKHYGVEQSKAGYRLKHGLDPFSNEDFRL